MSSIKDWTKAKAIDRITTSYTPLELATRFHMDPDASSPDDIKSRLRDLTRRELVRLLIPVLTDAEINAFDEVRSNRLVRPYRADWEAAILGEPTEVERERAAVKRAKQENDVAPTADQVAKLYIAPAVIPVMDPTGSFVDNVIVKKWVVNEDGVPVEVELQTGEIQ